MKYSNLFHHYRRIAFIVATSLLFFTNCQPEEPLALVTTPGCAVPIVKIDSEKIPQTIIAGETVQLVAKASGVNLTYSWSDGEVGGGFISENNLETVSYTTPTNVPEVEITIQVESEGCGSDKDSVVLKLIMPDIPTPTKIPASRTPTPEPTATSTYAPTSTPDMTAEFLETCTNDVTIANGTSQSKSIVVGANFNATWVLQNSGTCPWPDDLQWVYVDGSEIGYDGASILLESELLSGQEIELHANLMAPSTIGIFASTWQLVDGEGNPFGEPLPFEIRTYIPATPTPDMEPPNITKAEVLPGGLLTLEWSWIRSLKPDEYLAVRIWPVGGEKRSLTWTRDHPANIGITNDHFPEGDYFFNVAIVRGEDSENWDLVVESPEIPIYVPNIVIPTGGSSEPVSLECPPDC